METIKIVLLLIGFLAIADILFMVRLGRFNSRIDDLEDSSESYEDRINIVVMDEKQLSDMVDGMVAAIRAMKEERDELKKKLEELEELLPKDNKGEVLRQELLLRQMNDEMERGLKLEREWNDGVYSILNYGKPKTGGMNNE